MSSRIFNDRPHERTEFQLHISQFQTFHANRRTLRDFTEAKLLRYLEEISWDPDKKQLVTSVLNDYKLGRVAIAWKRGEPIYVRITNAI